MTEYVKCCSCENLHWMTDYDGAPVCVCFKYPWGNVNLYSRIASPRMRRKCVNYKGAKE